MPPVFDKDKKLTIVEYGDSAAQNSLYLSIKNKVLQFFKKK